MKTIKVFTKQNCAPCEAVTNFFEDNGVEVEFIPAFKFPDIASQFRIMSVPSTLLVDGSNEVLKQSTGFNPEELEEIITGQKE